MNKEEINDLIKENKKLKKTILELVKEIDYIINKKKDKKEISFKYNIQNSLFKDYEIKDGKH